MTRPRLDLTAVLPFLDQEATASKFGLPSVSGSKVVVVCKCGSTWDSRVSGVLRTLRLSGAPMCRRCRSKDVWSDPGLRSSASVRQSEVASRPEWRSRQSEASRRTWSSPEYRRQQSESGRRLFQDDDFRSAFSSRMKEVVNEPGYVRRASETRSSELFRRGSSARSVRLWASPAFRSRHASSMKASMSSPAARERVSRHFKSLWSTPSYRDRQSSISRSRWSLSEYRVLQAKRRSEMLGRRSSLETITLNILSTLGVASVEQKQVGPWTFDFFLPDFCLYIECQGEYTHSSPVARARDAAKLSYLESAFPSSRILYLMERDFLNPNLVRKRITDSIYGVLPSKAIDFDFSGVRLATMSRAKMPRSHLSAGESFLWSYHYAGYGRGPKAIYAAYLGDVVVSVCKFSSLLRRESALSLNLDPGRVLELDRFCVHPLYHKKNFASWLLSRFVKMVMSDHASLAGIISFADSTYGHLGTIYRASNWLEVGDVSPDYHYLSPEDGWMVHKKTLWNHASRMSMSESEYASANGYVKVYGKKKTKFFFPRP